MVSGSHLSYSQLVHTAGRRTEGQSLTGTGTPSTHVEKILVNEAHCAPKSTPPFKHGKVLQTAFGQPNMPSKGNASPNRIGVALPTHRMLTFQCDRPGWGARARLLGSTFLRDYFSIAL